MTLGVPLTFALQALRHHRLRTGLCLLGVAIGVTAVVLLTALGEGAKRYVDGQFRSLGSNLIFVMPGKTDTQGSMPGVGGAPNDLTLQDARAVAREVRQVQRVVPVSIGSETVSSGERNKQVYVLGSTNEFLAVRRLRLAAGSNLPELEWERGAPVILLGAELARELFPGRSAIGENVRVGDRRVRVIGVIGVEGQQLGLDVGLMGLVPVASAMAMYDETTLYRIIVQAEAHSETDSIVARLRDVLIERHDEEDFTCVTQDSVSGSLSSILRVLTLALAGIASVSLAVAGIGIMNVMLVSVSERTAEIGLLRALGAGRGQVRALFLAEAALISLAGGLIGLGLAWAGTRALSLGYPEFDATPPWWSVVAALVVSIGVGVVFGVLPANRATRLDPVVALRR